MSGIESYLVCSVVAGYRLQVKDMSIGLLNKENQGQYHHQESHKLTRPPLTKPYVATQSSNVS